MWPGRAQAFNNKSLLNSPSPQDGAVYIWTQAKANSEWDKVLLSDFGTTVWRVSWSVTGNVLAVSAANNKVTLWKQAIDGSWQNMGEVDEPTQ